MEPERMPSRAEQRMAAVAKLKRAASLPRMKDGRRPPMHVESVSEGEKGRAEEEKKEETETPPPEDKPDEQEQLEDPPEEPNVVEAQPEVEVDAEFEEPPASPEPTTPRTKRRSRSRSRSRGSKDFKGKVRNLQNAALNPMMAGDSSQDEAPAPLATLPPPLNLLSPIPSHLAAALQRSALLRSPTPTLADPSLFYPLPPSSPIHLPLPSLETLQLMRSNSAGGASMGRKLAMHKLTGGTESYEPSPSPTPPPIGSRLARNNTVAGEERLALRQIMFSRLGGRLQKDAEQAGSGEDSNNGSAFNAPRARRRSFKGTGDDTGTDAFISAPTPVPSAIEQLILRAHSTTPNRAFTPRNHLESFPDPHELHTEPPVKSGFNKPEIHRRRSVLVEVEDDDLVVDEDKEDAKRPPYPNLPRTPQRHTPLLSTTRLPHSSDAPSTFSTDSTSASAVGVPVYLSQQRTPSRNEIFPSSPFMTPLREKPSRDDDDERVLYPADSHRPRISYPDSISRDTNEREISWVADPVPEIRMPIHDDDDEDIEQEQDDPPLSARSSNGFQPAYEELSPRISTDSKSLIVESEPALDNTSSAVFSQSTPPPRPVDDVPSPQSYPQRLSVASRSPLVAEFLDLDDRNPDGKRNGEASPSTWEKFRNTFRSGSSTGRRSRTNSNAARERREQADSANRESGASLTSGTKDSSGGLTPQALQPQPISLSPSASASVLSLSATPQRGNPSPIPPPSSADLSKYQHAKLFPFPGMKTLAEQRRRVVGSASSPDVTTLSPDEDQPPLSASSFSNTPPEYSRDRKLSHQASDTRLVMKFNSSASPVLSTPSTSQTDYFAVPPLSPSSQQSAGSTYKLPMTLPGVKQWLSKNNKKMFSAQTPTSPSSSGPPQLELPAALTSPTGKKLSDLLRRKDTDLAADWEDIGSSFASGNGEPLSPLPSPSPRSPVSAHGVSLTRADASDIEKTPRVKNTMFSSASSGETNLALLSFNSSTSLRHDPPSSITPDPSSSLSDYPAHSTSESSSTSSSQYSLPGVGAQGSIVLERLDENLARGSRSPMWAAAIDDPSRKLIQSSPVLQVVNPNTVKDRFLFLFSDILVIAKPVIQDKDNILDLQKPSPPDRRYIVKNVVLLSQLRFNADRSEPQQKGLSYATPPRNPLIRTFIQQFARDPDNAINTLFSRSGLDEDPVLLGQLLFKLLELDRVKLGDYLARRTSKIVLKAYLDCFGFVGLRIDKALRTFLHSVHIPNRSAYVTNPLEHLLDSFASRWYEANARIVAYDKDLAIRLVRALVQLNELLHDGIAQDVGPTEYPQRNVTSQDFLEAFRRFDSRGSVPDELLEEIYDSIFRERLSQARNVPTSADLLVLVKKPVPPRLTYKVQSDPIIVRIPQADPNLSIHLHGQDLVFDPPVLNFSKSPEASFRVTGTSLGSKRVVMTKSGPNAIKYTGLPFSSEVMVERAFMRNTFQLAFLDHNGTKRRYMFSVDDPLIRHHWVVSLKNQITNASVTSAPTIPNASGTPKFYKAAQSIAFRILQETLIGNNNSSPAPSPFKKSLTDSAPPFLSLRLDGNGNGREKGVLTPLHNRSKSRSKFYHKHGAGKNELDLNIDSDDLQEDGADREGAKTSSDDLASRFDGPLWSGRDLELQCLQNSSIALVLSYLQVGSPEHGQQVSS